MNLSPTEIGSASVYAQTFTQTSHYMRHRVINVRHIEEGNKSGRGGTSRMHVNIHVNRKYINETVIGARNSLNIDITCRMYN